MDWHEIGVAAATFLAGWSAERARRGLVGRGTEKGDPMAVAVQKLQKENAAFRRELREERARDRAVLERIENADAERSQAVLRVLEGVRTDMKSATDRLVDTLLKNLRVRKDGDE